MTARTTQAIVRFSSAFLLPGFDTSQPAGEYSVDLDEEAIEFSGGLAWRRVGVFIHLPAIGTNNSKQQMVPINPADLDATLEKDKRS